MEHIIQASHPYWADSVGFFLSAFQPFPASYVSVGSTFDASVRADIHRKTGIPGATNFQEMWFPIMEGAVSQRGMACAKK